MLRREHQQSKVILCLLFKATTTRINHTLLLLVLALTPTTPTEVCCVIQIAPCKAAVKCMCVKGLLVWACTCWCSVSCELSMVMTNFISSAIYGSGPIADITAHRNLGSIHWFFSCESRLHTICKNAYRCAFVQPCQWQAGRWTVSAGTWWPLPGKVRVKSDHGSDCMPATV